ncbi:hypothetical protein J3R74_003031 [Puniceicoccus vermicola]
MPNWPDSPTPPLLAEEVLPSEAEGLGWMGNPVGFDVVFLRIEVLIVKICLRMIIQRAQWRDPTLSTFLKRNCRFGVY